MISLTSLGTLAIPFEFYQPLAIVMGIAFALSFGSLFMMQWMRSQRRMEAREGALSRQN